MIARALHRRLYQQTIDDVWGCSETAVAAMAEDADESEGEPTTSLGYLWSLPHASRDPLGLGGSITWQWDERLCDVLTSSRR